MKTYQLPNKSNKILTRFWRTLMLIVTLSLLLFSLAACGGDEEASTASSGEVAASNSGGLLKFIYFSEEGCDPCTRMNPIIEALGPDYTDVLTIERHDATSEDGKKLMEQYELKKTPSYVIVDGSGAKLWSNAGEIHKDMLRQQIKALTGK